MDSDLEPLSGYVYPERGFLILLANQMGNGYTVAGLRPLTGVWRGHNTLKITGVEALHLRLPEVKEVADGTQDCLLVRVHTDAGLTGLGEVASCSYVAKAVVEAPRSAPFRHGLAAIVTGMDATDIEGVRQAMIEGTAWYGPGGVARQAMSGIDMALWDLESWDDQIYDLQKVLLFGEFQPTGGLHFGGFVTVGDQIDYTNSRLGKRIYAEPFINWNISRQLMLRLRGVVANLETQSGEKIFDALVVDTRLTWQFSVRSFLRLTVQHSDVKRNP